MSRAITIWTLPGCSSCETVKATLGDEEFDERPLRAALDGEDPDAVDVIAQLAMQDHEAPVVRIDGAFVAPADLAGPAKP